MEVCTVKRQPGFGYNLEKDKQGDQKEEIYDNGQNMDFLIRVCLTEFTFHFR